MRRVFHSFTVFPHQFRAPEEACPSVACSPGFEASSAHVHFKTGLDSRSRAGFHDFGISSYVLQWVNAPVLRQIRQKQKSQTEWCTLLQ